MKRRKRLVAFAVAMVSTVLMRADDNTIPQSNIEPMVVSQFFDVAKGNANWKKAFATGKDEQIVFMNISPLTNPANEIGLEVHPFDQVILIVKGTATAVLNGKSSSVKSGDMIFIPQGTPHNVINSSKQVELKIISFYSATDIPKDAVYKTKADEKED